MYCPKLPNYRVFVGVWPPEMGYDKVPPTDQIIFFDAFYSDIRNDYIAFALDVETDRLGDELVSLDIRNLFFSHICNEVRIFLRLGKRFYKIT